MATPEQTQTSVCYRHPKNETAVSCSNCGRPICTDCMVFSAVGIKCPECAGQPTGVRRAATGVRSAAGAGTGALVTKTLIGINLAVFLLLISDGIDARSYAIYGPSIADGEWWRLLTGAFLHSEVNPLHIAFNMLMLWWFGRPLEELLGRGRFIGIYLVSALAGSTGALLLVPTGYTLGASAAVFGILGAGLVLERRHIYVFGGAALAVVVLNLLLSIVLANVSIGGHLGGLVGGMAGILVLSGFGRGHAVYGRIGPVEIAGLLAIAALSVAIAYLRVRGLA